VNRPVRSKLRDINLDDLDKDTLPVDTGRARSGPGAFTASLAMGREVVDENERLKARLAEVEDAEFIEVLDPQEVGNSKYANRLEESFKTQEYRDLKLEIEAAGQNVQPIKVRRLATPRGKIKYEIVFGHRRHRACLELGLPVRAIVEELPDLQLVIQMERENRGRANLSPWEQGMFYAKLLEENVFRSLRQLGEQLGVDFTLASRAVQLANLPAEVVAAFPSPLDLQYRWGSAIHEVLERDRERVLSAAQELAQAQEKLSAQATLDRLLGVSDAAVAAERTEIRSKGGKVAAVWSRDRKGAGVLKIKPGALSAAAERKLVEFLRQTLG